MNIGRLAAGAAVGAAFMTLGALAEEPAPHPVFELTRVHRLQLTLSAKEFETLNAVKGGFMLGNRPPVVDPPGETIERHKSAGGFGMEFPWARAALSGEGHELEVVGIRYKGNGSYLPTAQKLKRNFKVDIDRHNGKQRYHGLKTLNLNAGAVDPTRLRESLAYAIYRDAGVPAPRTALAEVTLTVPGKYDREVLGLYTMVEQADKAFLRDRFGDAGGMLLKPERLRDLDYLGETWEPYEPRYLPRDEPTVTQARRLIDFTRLIHRADDDRFHREIGQFLDIDNFLRFLAVTAMIANMDNVFFSGHNVLIYLHPKTNRFHFIPWDVDLAFAGFPFLVTSAQQLELSLNKPYPGQHRLVDRLLADPAMRQRYREICREIAGAHFTREKLLARIEALEAATKEIVAREEKAVAARKEPPAFNFFGRTPDLRTFVDKRLPSIADQLAGKTEGFVPTASLGPLGARPANPPGPGAGPGPRGGMGGAAFLTRPLLDALDADKDGRLSKEELQAGAARFFASCDKEKVGWINEKMAGDEINRIFPMPPGFGNPAGAGEERFPAGFGPGAFMAGPLVRKADADNDGRVTLAEVAKMLDAVFDQADVEKKGSLSEPQLAQGMRLLFPAPAAPPGFGVPGAPPRGEGKP